MFILQKMHAVRAVGSAVEGVNAVDFDGTNDYLTRGADLTGSADNANGILSLWVRLDGGDGSQQTLLHNNLSNVNIVRNSSNRFNFTLRHSSGASAFAFATTNTYTAGATWRHVLASWNTNFTAGNKIRHLYINDVSDAAAPSDSDGAFFVDYTASDWAVGANTAGGSKLNGCLAEFYFAPGQYLDFSVEANRRKFISAAGKPVELGGDGSQPTGAAPRVYLNNPAASFVTNKGTGGDLTVNGSLDPASTSPSD